MGAENSYMDVEMNRGFLQLLILVALEQRAYGYGIIRQLQEIGYSLDENTLYPLLRRLEKNGWVRSEWEIRSDRPRKFYVITGPGKATRDRALAIWRGQNAVLQRIMEVSNVPES
jgi:DNA-binding PadR family transcriptional regulator